jgi:AbrB family looped-hinge helix DNA binding protein
MKKAARITSKGQITVPHEIRRALGVRPGDKLLFERDRGAFASGPCEPRAHLKNIAASGAPALRRARRPL